MPVLAPTEAPAATTLRTCAALALGCFFGIFSFAATVGLRGSRPLALAVALAVAALVAWFWRQSSRLSLDVTATTRALDVLSVLATLVALVQLARLCVFILNPAALGFAIGPSRGNGLVPAHSCVSAYYVAARSASTTPNVYAWELYAFPAESPTAMRKPRRLESFNIDAYEYPPPFLLLPRALAVLAPDFLHFRMLWFALNGSVIVLGLLSILRLLGPLVGTRALLLSPLVLASDLTVSTLQIGNLQVIICSLAVIGMVLLARRHRAAGGAVLAFAIVSKLFPGVLLVYLLVRRKWRALAWTVAFMAIFTVISVLDTGWAPYQAFVRHLPALMSGESFPAFRNPYAVAKNFSVPGMAFKLHFFGIGGTSFTAMRIVGWLYTLVVLAVTVAVARRSLARGDRPLAWLTVLIVASLRSPFLPGYAVIPVLWLLTLLAARLTPTLRTLGAVVLAWAVLNISFPQQGLDPRLISGLLLLPQALIAVLLVLALRPARDVPRSPLHARTAFA